MPKSPMSVLFLGKDKDHHSLRALKHCQINFEKITFCSGVWGDPLPQEARDWEGDLIISYLSRWVVPEFLLKRAKFAAINFHPAPPEYPGIGCNNFALYDSANEFGVTCHHMEAQVDTGQIIAVSRFPILDTDDVASLLARTYDYQITLFYEVVNTILRDAPLPCSKEKWTRPPIKRTEFNKLKEITADMDRDEIARRVRATSFNEFGPVINLQGYRFKLER